MPARLCTATSLQHIREVITERSMRSKRPTWTQLRNAMTNRYLRLGAATEWFPLSGLLEPWVSQIPSSEEQIDADSFLVVYFGARALVVFDPKGNVLKALNE